MRPYYFPLLCVLIAGCSIEVVPPNANADDLELDDAGETEEEAPEDAAPPYDGRPPEDAGATQDAKDVAPQDVAPPQDVAQDAAKEDAKPQDSAPQDAKPQDSAPQPTDASDASNSNLIVQTDISITEVAIFQGIKVPLMKDGVAAKSTYAPIVAGRPGVLRVYVKPGAAYQKRQLTAELTLAGQASTIVRQVKMTVSKSSSESALDSTINFDLTDVDLSAGSAQFKVRLLGQTASAAPNDPPAQYPASPGMASIDVASSSKLKIVLVPVRYNADGSGRLPDVSAATVEEYRKAFLETYPVDAVDISVHAALPWASAIDAENGWDDLLDQVIALRAQDLATKDAYYLGIVKPRTTYEIFCPDSCTAGLASIVTNPTDSNFRAGVAISFSGDPYDLRSSLDTAIHETGHMHGRVHVGNDGTNPYCGTPVGLDNAYPYASGSIGTWGYGILGKRIYSPSTYSDFMGYCYDNWVSDYTYGALLTRVNAVVPLAKNISLPGGDYRFVKVGKDGSLRWGLTVNFPTPPTNNPITVRLAGANGATSNISGYYYPYGDREGGDVLVRKSDLNGKWLELDILGKTRTLATQ